MKDYTDKNLENQHDFEANNKDQDSFKAKEIIEKASYEDLKRIDEVKKETRTATLGLADEYQKTQGDRGIYKVVKNLNKIAIPFMIFSVTFSTYSFYQDLNPLLNGHTQYAFIISLIVGFIIGLLLEFLKDTTGTGAFTQMENLTRGIYIVVFVVIMGIVLNSHYGAIKQFEKQLTKSSLQELNNNQALLDPATNRYRKQIESLNERVADYKNQASIYKGKNGLNSRWEYKRKIAREELEILNNKIDHLENQKNAINGKIENISHNNITSAKRDSAKQGTVILFTFMLFEFMALATLLSRLTVYRNRNKEIEEIAAKTEDFISGIQSGLSTSKELFNVITQKDHMFNTFAKGQIQSQLAQMEAFITNKNLAEAMALNEIINKSESDSKITHTKANQKMGFIQDDKDMVRALFNNGKIGVGEKLTVKSKIVSTRNDDLKIRALYTTLVEAEIIEFRPSKGYFARASQSEALKVV